MMSATCRNLRGTRGAGIPRTTEPRLNRTHWRPQLNRMYLLIMQGRPRAPRDKESWRICDGIIAAEKLMPMRALNLKSFLC